jgi:hypothetical protein
LATLLDTPEIQWALKLLVASIAIIVLWAVLAFPAYIIERFIRKVREAIQAFAAKVSTRYLARWSSGRAEAASCFQPFFSSHSFRYVRDKNWTLWEQTLNRLLDPINHSLELLTTVSMTLIRVAEGIGQAIRLIQERSPLLQPLGNLPTIERLGEEFRLLRQAKARLLVSSVIISLLVYVNTGMLSQILRDVVEFGEVAILGPFKLYHFLALLLTFIEAGLGVLHANLSLDAATQPAHTYVPQGVTILGSAGLALVEGFFYSRVGVAPAGEQQVFSIPLLGMSLDMEHAFFFLGLTLPLLLAAFGHMWFRALMVIRETSTVPSLQATLRATAALSERLARSFGAIQAGLDQAAAMERELRASWLGVSESPAVDVLRRVEAVKADMEARWAQPPPWASRIVEELTEPEIRQQALRVSALLLLTLSASSVATWIHARDILATFPAIGPFSALAIALLQLLAFLSLGHVLRPAPLVAEPEAGVLRPVEGFNALPPRLGALAIVAFILTVNVTVLIRRAIPAGVGLGWSIALAIGAGLILLGREVASMLSMAECCFSAAVVLFESVCAAVAVWLLRALLGMFFVLEFLLGLVAAPATMLFERMHSGTKL